MLKRNDSYKSTRNCYIGGNNIMRNKGRGM